MNMVNSINNNPVESLVQQNLLERNRLQEGNNLSRLIGNQANLKEQLVNNSDSVSIQSQNLSEEDFQLIEQMSEEDIQKAMDTITNSYTQEVHNYLDPKRVAFLTGY